LTAQLGLRERKKQRTRLQIADAAMRLFLRDGFDRVTVADVAAAAEVSMTTVFNYFPTKEDLFFDRSEAVIDHLSRVVRDRPAGTSVIDACRTEFRASVQRHEWTSGLTEGIGRFYELMDDSPALQARALLMTEQAAQRLTATLGAEIGRPAEDPVVAAMARALVGVRTALHVEARRLMLAGTPLAAAAAALTSAADASYDALATGFAGLAVAAR
jgi:AcrR family transcriptional regulator